MEKIGLWLFFFFVVICVPPVMNDLHDTVDQQKETIAQYERTLEAYEQERENLQKQVEAYKARASDLHSDADSLRVQLDAAERNYKQAVSSAASKSEPAAVYPSGWSEKMAGVLRQCTAIAEERDQIALYYNELREQCKLK